MSLIISQPIVLIGHRGVGKSNLIARLKKYFPEQSEHFLDLDAEIEKQIGQNLGQFFSEQGEDQFRKTEQNVFSEIYLNKKIFILSLGAGFSVDLLPKNVIKIWLRRDSDIFGRIFFNRPRLEKNVSALQEYGNRWDVREPKFTNAASFQYYIPEGLDNLDPIFNQQFASENKMPNRYLIEKKIFSNLIFAQASASDKLSFQSIFTLLPEHFRQDRFDIIKKLNPILFECRNDLINSEQVRQAIEELGFDKILYSFRSSKTTDEQIKEYEKYILQNKIKYWDWGLELGPCPFGKINILSIHELPQSALISETELQSFIQEKFHLNQPMAENTFIKLSPICESFEELKTLWEWHCQAPLYRSVLPRSLKNPGRWRWFRLFMQDKQKINFFRCDQGSAFDQPYLFQSLIHSSLIKDNNIKNSFEFAAVLGLPTVHSRSPIRHHQFFNQRQMPFYNIDIEPEQFEPAIVFLQSLGLSAAAVTAPLKELAFNFAQEKSIEAKQLKSANTLLRLPEHNTQQSRWHCHNTDLIGLHEALQMHFSSYSNTGWSSSAVYVWGGGGTLPVIKKLLPDAALFSLRTGQLRTPLSTGESLQTPEIVIWAAGPQDKLPPIEWQPSWVLDLNYREDSLARQYALQVGAKYIDGLSMFEAQASAQQKFWSDLYGQ